MSVNKFQPHVWIIAEDDADRQLANGFRLHDAVAPRRISDPRVAGGWARVIDVFQTEFVPILRQYPCAHVLMLIDFDGTDGRGAKMMSDVPDEMKDRVFVVGSKHTPEALRAELKLSFEDIGRSLAEDCRKDSIAIWRHPHLIHNEGEIQRLANVLKPILFPK